MKMKKILIVFLVCLIYKVNAQTVEYDYGSNSSNPLNNPGLKNDNFARFKVSNINTYAQKVSIGGAVYNLNTKIPDGLKTLFQFTDDQVQSSLNSTNRAIVKMADVAKQADENAKSKTNDSNAKKAKDELDSLLDSCYKFQDAAKKISDALIIEKLLEETLSDPKVNTKPAMLLALRLKGADSVAIKKLKKDKEKFEKAYIKVKNQYIKASKASKDAQNETHEAKIDDAKETIIQEYGKLDKLFDKILNETDNLYQIANSDGNYFAISNPIYLKDADEVDFDVKIAKTEAELSTAKPITPRFNVGGGTKFDYSVGPVFNTLSDDSYFLDSKKMLQKNKNENAFTPGLAAMMHLTHRNIGNNAFGGMFGINANFKEITDVNLGFLGGLTAVFGKDQKVFVSTGVSFFKVSRLKDDQFKIGTVYTDPELSSATEKVLKPSFFIAVSLSIAKLVQIK
jgi:hypothetical protein